MLQVSPVDRRVVCREMRDPIHGTPDFLNKAEKSRRIVLGFATGPNPFVSMTTCSSNSSGDVGALLLLRRADSS